MIAELGIDTKVLVLTTFDLDEYVFAALRNGASGFLLKDALPDELLGAIRSVAAGDAVVAPSTTKRLLTHFADLLPKATQERGKRLEALTEREREVLTLLAKGLSNAEIAGELFLGEATIKTHVSNCLSKLHLRDRVQAVVFAYEARLANPAE